VTFHPAFHLHEELRHDAQVEMAEALETRGRGRTVQL